MARLVAALVVLGACSWPAAALAIDAKQEAAAQYRTAQELDRAGQHRLSLDHALQAWQLDNGIPAYLLLVGIQAHFAEELDQAEKALAQWLLLAGHDVAAEPAVQERLTTIQRQRQAAVVAMQAAEFAASGDHARARAQYEAALALDGGHIDYARAAGYQALAAGDTQGGISLLRRFLQGSWPGAPGRAEAEASLQKLGAEVGPGQGASAAAATGGWTRRDVGLWSLGGGLALAAAATGLRLWSSSEQDKACTWATTSSMSKPEQTRHQENASGAATAAIASSVLAVGAVGVGAWLYWLAPGPPRVAVVPQAEGLAVVGKF